MVVCVYAVITKPAVTFGQPAVITKLEVPFGQPTDILYVLPNPIELSGHRDCMGTVQFEKK